MAKTGKLTKLKSAIKRWPSFTKLARTTSSIAAANDDSSSAQYDRAVISRQLHAVYVGKSRRRYMVSSDVVEHPIIQELVDKSCEEEEGVVVVACEVVLFEHLLWMLQNAETQLGSMDELVEFYTC
ncbi:auxin-responsive protein SAUR78 [Argentina anserina]|uniref:auxin-responsive protein SAUR78 n=1 Tax=Argentina anserina TaxID=57926 RepID=UPI002176659B|nr:auxin-responsive protein SAUR78 [Potentilla anserina]